MDRKDVIDKVTEICRDVFEDDQLVLTEEKTSEEIDGWDSLTHLALINEIQDEFDIKLSLDEISKSQQIGTLLDIIIQHL